MSPESTITFEISDSGSPGTRTLELKVACLRRSLARRVLNPVEASEVLTIPERLDDLMRRRMQGEDSRYYMDLLGDEIFRIWLAKDWAIISRRLQGARSLKICSDLEEVLALPWELMRPPGGEAIGLQLEISRHIPGVETVNLRRPGPLHVLFCAAAPKSEFEWAEERIVRALEGLGVSIRICDGGRSDLARIAEAFRPHLVHISAPLVKEGDKVTKNELRPLINDLDTLPILDRELYYDKYPTLKNKSTKLIITTRGCPYKCTFCFNKSMQDLYKDKGKYVRYCSTDRIIEEIKNIVNKYGAKTIHFTDDVFILNKKRLRELFKKLKDAKMKIQYICLVRADIIDEELVIMLKESGCVSVFWGLQSGNEAIREQMLKTNVSNNQIYKAVKLLKKHKIKYRAYNIIGLPGETVENVYETLNLNIKLKTDYPWCAIFAPYKGTEIVDYAISNGFLKEEDLNNISESFHKTSVLKNEQINEIINIHKFFQTAVLIPWTLPLIKKLVKLPPNKIFELWFGLIYTYVFIISEKQSIKETMSMVLNYLPIINK